MFPASTGGKIIFQTIPIIDYIDADYTVVRACSSERGSRLQALLAMDPEFGDGELEINVFCTY